METSVSWLIKPRRAWLCSPSRFHIGAGFCPGDFFPPSDALGGSGLGRMLLGRRALSVPRADALFWLQGVFVCLQSPGGRRAH